MLKSSVTLKGRSADDELGGRAQVEAAVGNVGFIGGVGGRNVGLLESAGPVRNLVGGGTPDVPRFAPDGRTQLGTGFKELSFDGRATVRFGGAHALTLALYGYRQFDAPRTDQCPPPGARFDECLTITEQFIAAVKVGAPVVFQVDAYPGREFTGTVRYVSPGLETNRRALTIEAVVPNQSGDLKPGLFATARIDEPEKSPAIMVPTDAVLTQAGTSRVGGTSRPRLRYAQPNVRTPISAILRSRGEAAGRSTPRRS